MKKENDLKANESISILVVDDEEMVRDLLKSFLLRKGYMVSTASNGKEALQQFTSREFDLVLSDVRMPEMDGLNLLRELKKYNHRIPVILISAFSDVRTTVDALKAGAENFLAKPLKLAELGRVIKQSLDLHAVPLKDSPLKPEVRQETYMECCSQPEVISRLLGQIGISAVSVGFAPHDLENNLKLALTEAITNCMEHGNKWDHAKKVRLKCQATSYELIISVSDEGDGFDLETMQDPTNPENLTNERGRGIFLMHAIMDDVFYSDQGRMITLIKRKQL